MPNLPDLMVPFRFTVPTVEKGVGCLCVGGCGELCVCIQDGHERPGSETRHCRPEKAQQHHGVRSQHQESADQPGIRRLNCMFVNMFRYL